MCLLGLSISHHILKGNSFMKFQFCYCPPICMFSHKGLNEKIGIIHEKSLRLNFNGNQTPLDKIPDTLNEKGNSSITHWQSAKKFYRYLSSYHSTITNFAFYLTQNAYNLYNLYLFISGVIKSYHLLKSLG